MHSRHVTTKITKMADPRKPTNSSMIDLKAELFRKQEEYKLLKAQNTAEFVKSVKTSKPGKGDKIWSQKNAGVLQRASKDLAEKEEEDNVMDRSRRALEAKSKIYDKIASASGIPDDDGSEGYLVDFQKKAVDRIVEQRRGDRQTGATTCVGKQGGGGEMSDDDSPSEEPIPLPADPTEEWVDYVDTFGRSRRCMKKDLPHLEKQERPLGRPPGDGGLKLKEGATLLSADMKRELRRQQWEKEAEESVNGPVHYANVQYDEIRTHGTGFYQFSKDSNLREEQMEALNKLREQTMEGRQRSERIKEKRKAALEARLAKVKQRRKMKDGSVLYMEDKKEEEEEQKAAEDSTPQEAEPLTRDDSWRSSAPVREWDVGKEKLPEWNAKRYMEQRRSERENEFAPPQFYFDQKGTLPPATTPREQGAPPSNTRPQNGAGRDQSTRPSVPASSDTDAMLKQIRHSVVQRDREAGVDLASIPLPQISPLADNADSVEEGRQEAVTMIKDEETGEINVSHVRQHGEWAGPGYVPTPQQVYAGHQMAFCGPVLDVSLPPPGYPVQPQSLGQPAAPIPPPQSFQPSFTRTSSVPTEQDPSFGSAFVYPSQRGLLSSQPKSTSQVSTSQVTPSTVQSSAAKPTISKESRVKGSMVDKRFMQNREVSEEDLLGYMANTSDDDPLTKVQAVPYTPGLFSAGTSSQLQKPAPEARATSDQETEPGGQTSKPAGQTEGVIFGVPDFLQPAEVTATSYQPGSFMAAKEAAAQRAEEEYEAARKKTQYSSAPVLYGRPEDDPSPEQRGADSGEDGSKKCSVSPQGEEMDEEYAQFMRDVQGKK